MINIILLAFLVAVAIAVVRMKDLLSVIMLTGIYGLLSASFFVALDAVDVAFTEASVGAGISTLLMLVVISNTGRQEHPTRHKPLLALITVLITGALLVYGTFDMPYFGFADAPAHQHVAPRYIEDSLQETGLINIVTSVLASYRAFDTFGEVVVIFTAGIAVLAMLSFSQPTASDSEIDAINQSMHEQNLILRIVTKMLLPFIMLYALYVQFHGDFGPGGGFQAGVIFAAGIILYSLLFGLRTTRKVISESFIRLLAAFGILLYGSVGIYSLLTGSNYFDYNALSSDPVAGQHLGILLIELGVGLTVASVMILIFITFFGRGRVSHSPSKAMAKEN